MPAGTGIDVLQIEAGKTAAVLHQFALALDDVNQHIALAVHGGSELFGGAGRNGGVAMDQL